MIAEAGLAALVAGGGLVAAPAVARRGRAAARAARRCCASSARSRSRRGCSPAIAFLALIWLFLRTDLSVQLVAANSHSAKPWLYKFAGAWGNHEGSMLLWVTVLAVAGAAVALLERRLPQGHADRDPGRAGRDRARLLRLPALRLEPVHAALAGAGRGQRPQPAAAGSRASPSIRRPSISAMSASRSLSPSRSARWSPATSARPSPARCGPGCWRPGSSSPSASPPAPIGPITSSAGAAGGSGTRSRTPRSCPGSPPPLLLHSVTVLATRDGLRAWTVMLAVVAFSMSMIGTFLVRSGILTSVHAFAVDPQRGTFILALLLLYIGGALALFALRVGTREGGLALRSRQPRRRAGRQQPAALGRSSASSSSARSIRWSPRRSAARSSRSARLISTRVAGPIALVLVAIMAVGPLLRWRRDELGDAGRPDRRSRSCSAPRRCSRSSLLAPGIALAALARPGPRARRRRRQRRAAVGAQPAAHAASSPGAW